MDKDQLLDAVLKAFDEQIQVEKGERSRSKEGTPEFHYGDGRVDGVDTGRAIVEQVFLAESKD
ncbi:hypothetical protein [Photobacterium atrarenae]|uniref:Uncharacterized protein n=1 Tax=Photobacterium atrarenae TaxID=865757 RepID=A0ABY5GLJ0_9GAMM|nr:hypothetical protein [Photobacterium atrarenae]UTV30185.1 hypothetical protein NNL38_16495 [Photobacterium atrarenae]